MSKRGKNPFGQSKKRGRKMKKLVWAKTLLESYKYLSRVIDSLDRLVVERSAKSYTAGWYGVTTMEQIEQIIDLIQRKKRLQTVKMLIEEALKNIDRNSARVLIRYFINKIDLDTIAEECQMNKRTMSRKINAMLLNVLDKIRDLGYELGKIELLLENEGWIVGIFNKFASKFSGANEVKPLLLPPLKGMEKVFWQYCK